MCGTKLPNLQTFTRGHKKIVAMKQELQNWKSIVFLD